MRAKAQGLSSTQRILTRTEQDRGDHLGRLVLTHAAARTRMRSAVLLIAAQKPASPDVRVGPQAGMVTEELLAQAREQQTA